VDISDPPNLAITTATFHNMWIWKVDNPTVQENFLVKTSQILKYAYYSFKSTGADFSCKEFPFRSDGEFLFVAPCRIKQNN
jgi:hypothetical protein